MKRYVYIWFRHLMTNRYVRKYPEYETRVFVLAANRSGRRVVTASSARAESLGIQTGMVIADVRAMYPALEVIEDPGFSPEKLLEALAEWAIRFTPVTAIDPPDGILLDATGCTHIWGGEKSYLRDIIHQFRNLGYDVRVAMAGTPGAAQAVARYGRQAEVVESGNEKEALKRLPPEALQLEAHTLEKLHKLGLSCISRFIDMPPRVLRRRFGQELTDRIAQVLGTVPDYFEPVELKEPFRVVYNCLEPLRTPTAIRKAIERLLKRLCDRLVENEMGLQKAVLKTIRLDGKVQEQVITTHHPSCQTAHLIKLFELKIPFIEPDLGIETFILEAPLVTDLPPGQEKLWSVASQSDQTEIARLLDHISGKGGIIERYLPAEHYWPERSYRKADSLHEKSEVQWQVTRPRPVFLLPKPEPVSVAAPVPDYPPINFRYKGKLHTIHKADGPERIEQEWWLENGQHRDYFLVEDTEGCRYWIFRAGHYDEKGAQWFIHGFFA